MAFIDMYSWAAVYLTIVWMVKRVPFHQMRWASVGVCCFIIGMSLLTIRFWVANAFAYLQGAIPSMPHANMFIMVLPTNLLLFAFMVGAAYAVDHYAKYREREGEASRLELEATRLELKAAQLAAHLSQAQLQALKLELDPHFLFNTLNNMSSLVHSSPHEAEQMIMNLAQLFRSSVALRARQEITVREEINLLTPYIEIQRARFQDMLTFDIQIDEEVMDAQIPHLLLQPLVENAIMHGIMQRTDPGLIRIAAVRDGEQLKLTVWDSGGEYQPQRLSPSHTGVGTQNIRLRLQQLYGSQHTVEIAGDKEHGTLARIVIPYRILKDRSST